MRTTAFTLLAAGGLLLTGCASAGTDGADETSAPEQTEAATGPVTVGGPNFTEGLIMTEMYRLLLEQAGYDVTVQTVDNREVYAPALERGEIDVVPEYLATMTEYLNLDVNGPDAEPVATSDADETAEALQQLGAEVGLVPLQPAEAANQNAFFVTADFAADNGLQTLTDLGELGEPVVLAATEECPERPFCQLGLEDTYGITVTEVTPLGFGSPQTKQAVVDGQATLGLTGTTDGTLESFGLVILDDDQNLQLADNLVPVVSEQVAADEGLAQALDALAPVLTTDDLAALNAQVDQERQKPADVAQKYLQDKGLIAG
jgi:osmoprotectant transport system substrate-binding protein